MLTGLTRVCGFVLFTHILQLVLEEFVMQWSITHLNIILWYTLTLLDTYLFQWPEFFNFFKIVFNSPFFPTPTQIFYWYVLFYEFNRIRVCFYIANFKQVLNTNHQSVYLMWSNSRIIFSLLLWLGFAWKYIHRYARIINFIRISRT